MGARKNAREGDTRGERESAFFLAPIYFLAPATQAILKRKIIYRLVTLRAQGGLAHVRQLPLGCGSMIGYHRQFLARLLSLDTFHLQTKIKLYFTLVFNPESCCHLFSGRCLGGLCAKYSKVDSKFRI